MRFIVDTPREPVRSIRRYPTAILRRDQWDDYGFKTTFSVRLHLAQGHRLDLDEVKILQAGQTGGKTEMPSRPFGGLGPEYCSVGQASSYYELLAHAGPEVAHDFLTGMRDMAYLPELQEAHQQEPGFETSLLRFPSARLALAEARKLLGIHRTRSTALSFGYRLPQGELMSFAFDGKGPLPQRLAIVIGYNGAGKTRLLANLAMLACSDRHEAKQPEFVASHGCYQGRPPSFGGVVAISYSAFDDFAVPRRRGVDALEEDRMSQKSADVRSYRYCGLRHLDPAGNAEPTLKSIDQLAHEFHRARREVVAKERVAVLHAALAELAREPSLRLSVELPADDQLSRMEWGRVFNRLSSGHKVVLLSVMQLCAYVERRSLVLIDEPEQHLHPSLLAALLKAIGAVLEAHDAFAVVATHSPVVLQEVPARSVHVLRRSGGALTVEAPRIETFAENVDVLTAHVFNLDSSLTDYQGVLRRLAQERTIGEIDALFGGRMSAQARSLVLSLQRSWTDRPSWRDAEH